MSSITQITPVKNRPVSLFRNISNWLKSGIDQLVLVDYACPQRTHEVFLRSKYAQDPRIVMIHVNELVSGPFYSHAKARNIGVHAAKHEILFFVDVDVRTSRHYVNRLRKVFDAYDKKQDANIFDAACTLTPHSVDSQLKWHDLKLFKTAKLPDSLHRQLAVRSALFYDLNGFDQDQVGWGCETYDFLMRAHAIGASIRYLQPTPWLSHKAHEDTLRSRFNPIEINASTKERAFADGMDILQEHRSRSHRAHPGRQFGVTSSNDMKVYHRCELRSFNPGDDL